LYYFDAIFEQYSLLKPPNSKQKIHRSLNFFSVRISPWKRLGGRLRGRVAACTWCKNAVGRAPRLAVAILRARSSPCAKSRAGFSPLFIYTFFELLLVLIRLITWSGAAERDTFEWQLQRYDERYRAKSRSGSRWSGPERSKRAVLLAGRVTEAYWTGPSWKAEEAAPVGQRIEWHWRRRTEKRVPSNWKSRAGTRATCCRRAATCDATPATATTGIRKIHADPVQMISGSPSNRRLIGQTPNPLLGYLPFN